MTWPIIHWHGLTSFLPVNLDTGQWRFIKLVSPLCLTAMHIRSVILSVSDIGVAVYTCELIAGIGVEVRMRFAPAWHY